MRGPLALLCAGVSKTFAGAKALDQVSLEVGVGEIHALVGQNGSGKSTLIKILTGVYDPDPGAEVVCWGRQLSLPIRRPGDNGIAVIHQDLALDPRMTVLENMGIAGGFGASAIAPIDWRSERRRAKEAMDRLGQKVPLDALVGELSPADRAITAILRASRALSETEGRQLFILDEPTAYLNAVEAERLYRLMRNVAANGDSVVFISHFLPEVLSVCNRMTVLRDGRVVTAAPTEGLREADLVQLMLGREMGEFYPERAGDEGGDAVLAAEGLSGGPIRDLDLTLRSHEIVGLTGLAGSGFDHVPYLLSGAIAADHGVVTLDGIALSGGVRPAMDRGVVLVPADRRRDGVWTDASAAENVTLPVLRRYVDRGVLRGRRERTDTRHLMEQFLVRPPAPEFPVSGFSGGNQQKLVLAKWLQAAPRVLLLDEPTQGVDAGARRDILELVRSAVEQGATALLCSSDHEQLAAVCSRVIVMADGRVVDELPSSRLSEESILMSCHAA